MTLKQINMLQEMVARDSDIFWVTDENWKIQNAKYTGIPENLPELLGLPEDFWDNTEKMIFWDGFFYRCRIWCSRHAKCRAIALKLPPVFETEDPTLSCAVHSLRQIRKSLQENMEKEEQAESQQLLDSIERNCMLLYRPHYISRMLRGIWRGTADRDCFSVQDILRQIQDNLHSEMSDYAETELIMPERDIFLYENMEFFRAVVLAGLTLCHVKHGYFQQAAFSLDTSAGKILLLVSMTPDLQKPVQMSGQIDSQNFGSFQEEQQLLDTFCQLHDGSWNMLERRENGQLLSACCQILFRSDELKSEITMHSGNRIIRNDFDTVYRMMLSRIYLSHF